MSATGNNEVTKEKLFPLPFWFFHEYVARYYNWAGSNAGWTNIILKETNYDEEKGIWKFYELFDNFKKLAINQCFFAEVGEKNILYHYTNKYAPTRSRPPDYKKSEPLYINPVEIFLIELTFNAGYLCMVNTDSQHILNPQIYKDKETVDTFIQQCFGVLSGWKCIEMDNIAFYKNFEFWL